MINYGIVYGLSDYGLADRLGIPREEAKAIIDAYLERFPRGARVHRGDDREGAREDGYVHDAVGPPAPDPRAQGAQLEVRTLGERLAVNTPDPGHGRRRHQARDGPRHEALARGSRCGRSSRCTTSCSSRARRRRSTAVREDIVAAMVGVWEHEPPLVVDVGVAG